MNNESVISNAIESAPQRRKLETSGWLAILPSLCLGLGILFFSYAHTLIDTISVWNDSSFYRVGWLVLPTIVLLLFFSRKDLQSITPVVSWYGVLFGLTFVILWIASDLINVSVLRQLALIGIICSLVFTAVGGTVFRVLFPYLALLLLAIPIWEVLLPGLKSVALQFVTTYTKIVSIPLTTDGFAFFVGNNRYVIIDYCAGLSYVLTGLLIGASYGLLIYRNYLKIALIALAGGCVAILANGIRISSIISFEYFTGINIDDHHYLFDLPVIIPCFATFFFFLSKLKSDKLSDSNQPKKSNERRPTFYSNILIVITAVLFSVGPLFMNALDRLELQKPALPRIEEKIGEWIRSEKVVDWHPEILSDGVKEDFGLYILGETEVLIYVAETRRSDVKISGQAISLANKDWMKYSRPRSEKFCIQDRCYSYGYSSSALKNTNRVRHIYFGYVVDGMITNSTLSYRVHRAFANFSGKGSSARYIAIVFEGKTELPQNTLSSIFRHLVPLSVVE